MSVTISASGLPVIDRAGLFPLLNPVFEFTYRNPTNALHLYDYPARIRIHSKELVIRPGDITCIQSGTVYSIASEAPGQHWCIHYHDIAEQGGHSLTLPGHLHLGVNSLFYREQIQHISRLHGSPESPGGDTAPLKLEARFRLKALLLALHNRTAAGPAGRRSRSDFSWEHLLGWVDENLDQPISIPMLAERAKRSPGTIARKFKEAHRSTLTQYLLLRRIDRAKSLLATTTLTIFEVGSAVGIPDAQYFNKQFRKCTGISPSRYREENQEYLGNSSDELAAKEGEWTT
ncbi:MAG TPA: AraC family transcriptional regulator [Luteolibacter sp.]|nr:AraC family transcriptional regulator [Luteolibacter sp.]